MKLKNQNAVLVRKNKKIRTWPLKAAVFGLGLSACLAQAQSVLAPAAPSAPLQTVDQQSQTNEFEVFPPENAQTAGERQPFQAGPFIARPHVSYQFLYGTGIQSSPGDSHDTTINTISLGILLEMGQHWSLDYTPTLRFYSDNHFNNEFDNSFNLVGATAYENWTLGLTQGFTSGSSPQVETGSQTDQQNYTTTLNASYAFNDRFSVDMSLNQTLNYVNDAFGTNGTTADQDSESWSTTEFLNYNFTPRFNIGVGGSAGYVNVNIGPDQIFENLSGRINWRATDKISLQVNGGMEFVQFSGGGESDLVTPVFGATIQYQPFKDTQISLNASRSVSPSTFFFVDSVTETTAVTVGLNQQFLKKYSLNLSGGYTKTEYTESVNIPGISASADRTDDSWVFNAQLGRNIWKRGNIAATYTYSSNSSTEPGFGYSSNQVGVQFSYTY